MRTTLKRSIGQVDGLNGNGHSPLPPLVPVVGVHVSLLAWIAAACLSVALAARFSPSARVTALAIVLAAPLGFGTVRDALR